MHTPCENEPDLWFSTVPEDQYEAIQACQHCPIAASCGKWGDDEIRGVWGGKLNGYTAAVVQPTMQPCAWVDCGQEFVVRTKSVKYCSADCQKLAQKARARARPRCAWEACGKQFTPKMKSQRFCCPECGRKNKRATAHRTKGLHRLNELVKAAAS